MAKSKNKKQQRVQTNERAAGILLHITSLPSAFGIGDMGPEAYAFVTSLNQARQTYWQLLPLNPTEQGKGNSPYSSTCSRAGNTLLISPERLVADKLLTADEVTPYIRENTTRVDYADVEKAKYELFDTAWKRFSQQSMPLEKRAFQRFTRKEKEWLDDFSLYTALKKIHGGAPWYDWSDTYKLRDEKALKKFRKNHAEEIEKVQWLQYLFFKQWYDLRLLCNEKKVQLLGDLPFYVSYDSSDVWANRGIFKLDKEGRMLGVAGVPPDYFNENGQLWGMPVFNWKSLKKQRYAWWIKRIQKNMELYDLLRLDHFRAFADYWEVPAGETTARNGRWKPGPGNAIFETLTRKLGHLPFVAEDLGDINEAVYALRDKFLLPGMKVLQFAFSDNMAESDYIPHNYSQNFVVYTGTHDNNTTVGWYKNDCDTTMRKRIQAYCGVAAGSRNIHLVLARLAYASVAKIVILPVQDILGLDERARMNIPAAGSNNWQWRLMPGEWTMEHESLLHGWTMLYKR